MEQEEKKKRKKKVDYKNKPPMRDILLEFEKQGIIKIYEDGWGKVQIRITGGWS